jgi:UDP-N-acetylmuramate: L-alanyl-gamma-D-glutamyl-meso-diaminopimelate ligase
MKDLTAHRGEDSSATLAWDSIARVYIQGICGSAMAGVAGILCGMGKKVSGSDRAFLSPMKEMLDELAVLKIEGYRPENLDGNPDLVVVGNVMSRAHPESVEVRRRNIPYVSFPELFEQTILCEKRSLVVAGTHGKTTTTTLLAHVLESLGEKPGFLAGGVAKGFDATARLGGGSWFVIEGDEYETSYFDKGPKFLHYRPHAAILTSVEYDHADIFKTFEDYLAAFGRFADACGDKALLAVCADDVPAEVLRDFRGRLKSYSAVRGADLRLERTIAVTPEGSRFLARVRGGAAHDIFVPLWGRHNIRNAMAVFLLLTELGFKPERVAKGLSTFPGVRRRGEVLFRSPDLWVVDDFAHHPTAVKSTLDGLKEHFRDYAILAVFEPRTNTSRTRTFQDAYAESFSAADGVVILPPPAGKAGEEPFSPEALAVALCARGCKAKAVSGYAQALEALPGLINGRTLIVTLSNGSMDGLPQKISSKFGVRSEAI